MHFFVFRLKLLGFSWRTKERPEE